MHHFVFQTAVYPMQLLMGTALIKLMEHNPPEGLQRQRAFLHVSRLDVFLSGVLFAKVVHVMRSDRVGPPAY